MTLQFTIATFRRFFQILLLLIASMVGEVFANEAEEIIKINLYPAAEPTPALKYRLLPKFIDRKPGNAAVFYGKVTAEQTAFFRNRELREKMESWRSAPLSELLAEDAHVPLNPLYLRQGALCTTCDWQMLIHEGKFFELLLPEVQQTREFGRILATQSRIQIAHGEFEQAIESFQTGFALGRNVAAGETLVNGLVGIAISKEMLKQVAEFVQQPNAPNLYWAIAMLPRPFIDLREGLEAEMSAFELSYPELRDLETKRRSPNDWQDVLHAFSEYYALFSDQENSSLRVAGIYLKLLKSYPDAKQSLITRGMEEKQVEAMSKEQVVSLPALYNVKRWQQEVGKYYHLPYPAAIKGITAGIKNAEKEHSEFARALGGLMNTRKAIARNTRRFEVLRIIEALRIHAAVHDGKLPAKLEDITEVPIPIDPVTGTPFQYQLEGEKATLRGPAILDAPLHYEITMNSHSD